MYDKDYYRTTLNGLRDCIKLTYFAKQCNIQLPNLSRFLKGKAYDDTMNIDKLEELHQSILDRFSSL